MGTVGIDIGGSGVRAALVDAEGSVGEVVRVSLTDRSVDAVVGTVATAAERLGARRVGVGMPGFIRGAVVTASPNFPAWRDVPLGDLLRTRLGVPVTVENDANAAAMGAWRQLGGALDLVLLTLGTGVGGGVISAGRLLRGSLGTGAELGHIYVGGDAPCGCGGVGCLETWSGTVGLTRLARERGHAIDDGAAVIRAAEAGEAWAVDVLQLAARHLAIGVTSLVNVFNPDVFALAGGLTSARRWLAPAVEERLARHGVPASAEHVRLTWLARADDLAIAGAAESAREADA